MLVVLDVTDKFWIWVKSWVGLGFTKLLLWRVFVLGEWVEGTAYGLRLRRLLVERSHWSKRYLIRVDGIGLWEGHSLALKSVFFSECCWLVNKFHVRENWVGECRIALNLRESFDLIWGIKWVICLLFRSMRVDACLKLIDSEWRFILKLLDDGLDTSFSLFIFFSWFGLDFINRFWDLKDTLTFTFLESLCFGIERKG